MATGDLHKKFCADWSSRSRDILADRQSHTHTQTDKLIAIHPLPGVKKPTQDKGKESKIKVKTQSQDFLRARPVHFWPNVHLSVGPGTTLSTL